VDSVHCASIQTTAVIDPAFAKASFTVSPNPLRIGQDIMIEISDLPQGNVYDFTLLDQNGKLIQQWAWDLQEGNNNLNLSVNDEGLSVGVYYLHLSKGNQLVQYEKLVLVK